MCRGIHLKRFHYYHNVAEDHKCREISFLYFKYSLSAFLESHCLLILYILCVSTIFCIEIAAGVIGLVRKNELETDLIDKLVENMKTSAESWDIIQQTNKCCGVNNYTDWKGEVATPLSLPDSCCLVKCRSVNDAYPQPCYTKLRSWVFDNLYIIGAASLTIGILQIILLIIASIFLCLMRQ
ncbi:leukocyte surface antigen CD53-like [Octopus vulgaris]|uniref:Tetraspanin n=1 Tax=Octopus vulgaris TaxID=6645 RepID=A0AA36F589_OCTVU|nr:leukocyte surface antigen CD53-like [Octopus vulgaris]